MNKHLRSAFLNKILMRGSVDFMTWPELILINQKADVIMQTAQLGIYEGAAAPWRESLPGHLERKCRLHMSAPFLISVC